MFLRRIVLALGLTGVLASGAVAEDLTASGTAGFDFVCTTALDPLTGAMVSHFTVVDTTRTPPRFLGRLKLQALVATSPNRRFQAAPLETAIAHDPTAGYAPPTMFGVFFVPTDAFGGSAGSITVIDNRTSSPVRTTLALPNPCVYDVLLDSGSQRAYCAYVGSTGALEVQALDYSTATPFLLGAPVVLPGPPTPYATRLSINPSGNRLYAPLLAGVAVLSVGGTPALFNTVALPPNSAFVATNIDSNFPLNGNQNAPWNICATDASASATTGANVLVFNVSGGTVYTLGPGGFGAPNGVQLNLASGFNDPATVSGWLGQTNPAYLLLRDPAAPTPQGTVGVIDNTLVGGALNLALAPATGEPFGNPNTRLAPNEICFTSYTDALDFVATLARAFPPGAVASTALLGYVNPSDHDMPVISQGGSAASVHTRFVGAGVGFETYAITPPPPAFVGNVATGAASISLPGAWRGPLVFPLTAVATANTTALVQCPIPGLLPYMPFVFGGTGGRANFPLGAFPFVPMPPAPPYAVTIAGLLGPKRPAFNQSANTGAITNTNVAFDAGAGGVAGGAMAIVPYGGPSMTIVPIPGLTIGQTTYSIVVLSSEILPL